MSQHNFQEWKTIVEDFQIFMDYCERETPKLTKSRLWLSAKACAELNELLSFKQPTTGKKNQDYYLLIHLLYFLAIDGELFKVTRVTTSNIIFHPIKDRTAYFRSLTPEEQYVLLLKTLWINCDWDKIQSVISGKMIKEGVDKLMKYIAENPKVEHIDLLEINHTIGLSIIGTLAKYLEFFGWWKTFGDKRVGGLGPPTYDGVTVGDMGRAFAKQLYQDGRVSDRNRYSTPDASMLGIEKAERSTKELLPLEKMVTPILGTDPSKEIEIQREVVDKGGVYQFKVHIYRRARIWRMLLLNGEDTLEALHLLIQKAFRFDNDHLYRFHLDGMQRSNNVVVSPWEGERRRTTNKVTIQELALEPNDQLWYIFDYGDYWQFVIKLESIAPGVTNPTVIASKGEAPKQYGNW